MSKPSKLGAKIDAVYKLRAERIEYQHEAEKKIDSFKEREKRLKGAIISELREQKLAKGSGSVCTATITQQVFPQVTDWDRVYAWVKKTGAFEIFEKRISRAAFKERYEAGEGVPGVDAREEEDLSLTKA